MNKPDKCLIEIRSSPFGKGLFALNAISCNSVLCKATGKQLTFSETLQLHERESHSLQIDTHTYILCEEPFLYSNHSCNPNCALNENLELYTIKDVQQNEELVWDYSTSMYERHWTMQCLCGSPKCRKVITDFDLLTKNIQIDYLNKKIVLPFIACQLKENAFLDAFRA